MGADDPGKASACAPRRLPNWDGNARLGRSTMHVPGASRSEHNNQPARKGGGDAIINAGQRGGGGRYNNKHGMGLGRNIQTN